MSKSFSSTLRVVSTLLGPRPWPFPALHHDTALVRVRHGLALSIPYDAGIRCTDQRCIYYAPNVQWCPCWH